MLHNVLKWEQKYKRILDKKMLMSKIRSLFVLHWHILLCHMFTKESTLKECCVCATLKVYYTFLKVYCVTFGDFYGETATSSGSILDCSAFTEVLRTLPHPELASEPRWPARTNLKTSSAFFFIDLFEAVSIHPKHEPHCQVDWIVLTRLP